MIVIRLQESPQKEKATLSRPNNKANRDKAAAL